MCAYEPLPKRILIIDDDIDLLMLLERSLQKKGYLIETAASLSEGEEIISSFEPHLVLLDINVKGQDGRQLCWKLKMEHETSDVKVIVVSGYDYNATRAMLFGADYMLPKPFNFEFLAQLIGSYLEEAPGLFSFIPVADQD